MNDVSNRAVREFSEFLNSIEADFPKPTCTTAYVLTEEHLLTFVPHRNVNSWVAKRWQDLVEQV